MLRNEPLLEDGKELYCSIELFMYSVMWPFFASTEEIFSRNLNIQCKLGSIGSFSPA